MHHFSILDKAKLGRQETQDRGMHDERDPESLLVEMIAVHMENVAVGGVSAYMNYLLIGTIRRLRESDLAGFDQAVYRGRSKAGKKRVSGFVTA